MGHGSFVPFENVVGRAILISWPIYAATFAFTAWAIHRVTSEQKTAEVSS